MLLLFYVVIMDGWGCVMRVQEKPNHYQVDFLFSLEISFLSFLLFSEQLCFGLQLFVPHVLYAHIRLASIIFLIVVGSKPI